MIDPLTVSQIAARYNIPPPVLYGMTQVGSLPALDTADQLDAYASALSTLFARNGSWEAALSALVSGDPAAYQSAAGTTGSTVNAIMGVAGARPTWGMSSYVPSSMSAFVAGSRAFGQSIGSAASLGGVVTPQHQTQWYQTAKTVTSGDTAARAQGSYVNPTGRSQGASPVSFSAMPFDPKWFSSMTEDFGDRSGPGGYAEMGNDYGLPRGTPLQAPIEGTVKVVRPSNPHSNTGLTVYIVRPDGARVYIGHMGETPLQDGQHISAGTYIGTSGGDPLHDAYPGNSTGPHIEIGIYDAKGVLYDPHPVLQSVLGDYSPQAQPPPQATDGHVSPSAVDDFSKQLKSSGITPEAFNQLYPSLSAARRRLMGGTTQISDLVPHLGQTPDQAVASLRAQPHSIYPEHSVGSYWDAYQAATLSSMTHASRPPNGAEVSRFVSAGWGSNQIDGYYRQLYAPDQLQPSAQTKILQQQPDDQGDQRRRKGGTTSY